ncbi:MAG TPA: glutathione S-transferase family protein [Pseudorhodoplanes sp.]|jgi:glutathione S-transferase|nr:glutathione S-transferase family protein [Pseudorhodoplanes sp.]
MALTLVIGNKNYSSWSFRPWIAMKVAGIAFEEKLIPLQMPDTKSSILQFSPAGKVPVLLDGDVTVWESLAILDYLADRFPDRRLWPSDPAGRAHARSIAAEMHGGFAPLRTHCPMNMRRPPGKRNLPTDAAADARRIDSIWTECRKRFGGNGPFLFGAFGAADAMYAPVVSRFVTYEIDASPQAREYIAAVTALPAWAEWRDAGVREPWRIDADEID